MSLSIDGLTPRTVESPPDYETVARVLKKASDEHCAVTPLGGGTMLELGAPLRRADVVVSLENLNRVLDHQPANLTVRTQAGITLAALNQMLAKHGQYLPLDPPFPDRATIGGILATNSSGSLRVRFGSARDLVIGIRAVLADGQVVHGGGDVVKNVAGYDIPKIFVGSLGTLGIIVEATFKIVPLPAKTSTFVALFDKLEGVCEVALRLIRSPLLPSGVEILNPTASTQFGWGERFAFVVRFGGLEGAVGQQLREVEGWSRENGALTIAVLEADDEVWARLRDLIAFPTVVKIGVVPTQVKEAATQAEGLARSQGLNCSFLAHAVGILFVGLEGDAEHIETAIAALREAVTAIHGNLIIQRAPRELRDRIDVWGATPRGSFGVMRKLKQELDPNGILNPGRFVGGI